MTLFEKYNPLKHKVFQLLDSDGNVIDEKLLPSIDDDKLLTMYKTMFLGRIVDTKAQQYQRQGRMLTYAPNKGQEAAQVGVVSATETKDWLVPSFRELSAMLYKGVPLEKIFLYWYGNERGSEFPEDVKVTPISVPIASQLNHAVGIAYASQYKETDEVTIGYVGDGGTSHGEFHEALNFAGVFQVPLIVVIQNNQYAISYSRKKQTKSETLAQKAIAYGIPGIQVDGNDVLAMYKATEEAVKRASEGKGPTLIEAVTYRLGAHTTSDDPTIYRDEKEVKEWELKDPLIRFKKYLIDKKIWNDEKEEKLKTEYESLVNETFKKVENSGLVPLEDIFNYQYETLPNHLKEQYEAYKNYLHESEGE